MKTAKKNSLKKAEQIDRMIDEGLGAGLIVQEMDKRKLETEEVRLDDKNKKEKENGTMVNDMEDLKKLGKEMNSMSTNTEVKSNGQEPDPIQHNNNNNNNNNNKE